MLKDRKVFAVLPADEEDNIYSVARKISLRRNIGYNECRLGGDEKHSYVLYPEADDKQYIFDMCRSKKLKLIWKDEDEFYMIDFRSNPKGEIISDLTFDKTDEFSISGAIVRINLKEEFRNLKKVQLLSSGQVDEKNPYSCEYFKFYKA